MSPATAARILEEQDELEALETRDTNAPLNPSASTWRPASPDNRSISNLIADYSRQLSDNGSMGAADTKLAPTTTEQLTKSAPDLGHLKPRHQPKIVMHDIFVALEEREGTVLEVSEEEFSARLTAIGDLAPDEEAEFPLEQLSDDDRKLLMRGAIFNWTIGYIRKRNGQKQPTSQILFRRMPAWSKKDIQEADEIADKLAAAFETNESDVGNADKR